MLIRQFPDEETFVKLAETHNVIPVCIETLADTETPVSLLKKISARGGPVFLLESVEGGERWGRYSFLGASARCHVRVYADFVEIQEKSAIRQIPHHGDPFSILRALMGRYNAAHIPGLPRFWGGLVGYFTYETVSFLNPYRIDCRKISPSHTLSCRMKF
jgi:anthranilate synthase component 1